MPPVIQAENLSDLINSTLPELGEMRFTDISSPLQDHPAMRVLLKKNRIQLESGTSLQFNVMTDHNHSAAAVGLYASDNPNRIDVMTKGNWIWRHVTASYALDRREIAMNRTPRKIVDLVLEQRIACMVSLALLMEQLFWSAPNFNDPVSPHGLPLSVTKAAGEGFNGGVLTGFPNVYGLSPTQYPAWQNWSYIYRDVSREDFIRHARQAAVKTHFRPPVQGIPSYNTGDTFGAYANYAVLGQLEEALEAQNENLGPDIASQDGNTMFRRTPVTYVPFLDRDTTNPFYFINWGWFKVFVLRDEWLHETHIPIMPGQHTVAAQFVDCSFNWINRNRRAHAVLALGTTYPN